jgi:hypothetical protein
LLELRQRETDEEAPLFPSFDSSLAASQIDLGAAVATWMVNYRAIGKRDKRLQAKINPRVLASGRQRSRRYLGTREASVPAIGLAADGDSLGLTLKRTVELDGDATNLGEAEKTAVQGRPAMLADLVSALFLVENDVRGLHEQPMPASPDSSTNWPSPALACFHRSNISANS